MSLSAIVTFEFPFFSDDDDASMDGVVVSETFSRSVDKELYLNPGRTGLMIADMQYLGI